MRARSNCLKYGDERADETLVRVLSENRHEGSGRDRPHRAGVCHRCGWSGSVCRVARADRRRMKNGRAFGRLCDPCIEALLGRSSVEVPTDRPKLVRRRDVA